MEMDNFKLIGHRNENKENAVIEICNKGNLIIKNALFKNNITKARTLIEVKETCSLEVLNSTFEGNLTYNYDCESSCIFTLPKSNLKLSQCQFVNHLPLNENLIPNKIIDASGNTFMTDCHFENNQGRSDSRCGSIYFGVI